MDPKVSEEERRDTLLRAALEWYELHPNRRPKDYMRALYYYGYRQHRLKDYSTAIYYLTRAQEWAEKLDNPFYSGMAFREIGSAYLLSFNKFLDFHKLVLYIVDPLRPGLYRGHTRAFFPDGVRIAFS